MSTEYFISAGAINGEPQTYQRVCTKTATAKLTRKASLPLSPVGVPNFKDQKTRKIFHKPYTIRIRSGHIGLFRNFGTKYKKAPGLKARSTYVFSLVTCIIQIATGSLSATDWRKLKSQTS